MTTYHNLGKTTLDEFKKLASDLASGVHTYLSDGDRGHRVWAFYTYTDDGEIKRKYVSDGLKFGYYVYRQQ